MEQEQEQQWEIEPAYVVRSSEAMHGIAIRGQLQGLASEVVRPMRLGHVLHDSLIFDLAEALGCRRTRSGAWAVRGCRYRTRALAIRGALRMLHESWLGAWPELRTYWEVPA